MSFQYIPGYNNAAGSFVNDGLIAGDFPIKTKTVTLKAGTSYARGHVLEQSELPTVVVEAASAAKTGGNTGDGTLTLDATTPTLAGAKAGVYAVRCTVKTANNGTFRVTDPDGFVLGDIVMAAGAGTFANDVKFALADGATDFEVGDGFDITVTITTTQPAALKYKEVAVSANAKYILLEDVDATGGDKLGNVAITGQFNSNKLTIGDTASLAGVAAALEPLSIFLEAGFAGGTSSV